MLAVSSARQGSAPAEEECVASEGSDGGREVGCTAGHLVPMMKRSRGVSACVCVDGQKAAEVEADEFVYVRYEGCSEEGQKCRA
jgi:hypothetical protein